MATPPHEILVLWRAHTLSTDVIRLLRAENVDVQREAAKKVAFIHLNLWDLAQVFWRCLAYYVKDYFTRPWSRLRGRS